MNSVWESRRGESEYIESVCRLTMCTWRSDCGMTWKGCKELWRISSQQPKKLGKDHHNCDEYVMKWQALQLTNDGLCTIFKRQDAWEVIRVWYSRCERFSSEGKKGPQRDRWQKMKLKFLTDTHRKIRRSTVQYAKPTLETSSSWPQTLLYTLSFSSCVVPTTICESYCCVAAIYSFFSPLS